MENPLITRIKRLEDEVQLLRKERDRFKRISSNAEEETAKWRAEYLALEGEYEDERKKRVNAERLLDSHTMKNASNSTTSKRLQASSSVVSTVAISKVDMIIQTEQSSSKTPKALNNQDIKCKALNSKEVICIASDADSAKSVRIGPPVRASKRIPTNPKSKEVVPLTASSISISTPKKEKKRPVDQVSMTIAEELDEPVRKAPKINHTESKPGISKPTNKYPPPLAISDNPTTITTTIPKNESKGKGKAKAETGFVLRSSEVSKYMEGASVYIINPPPKPPKVSRVCLTETYGLPGMGLLWISKDKRHQFLLPTHGVNPEMPRSAGAPGLLLSCRNEMCDGSPWTLFIPIIEEKKARWIYVGEYIGETVGLLSAEDFRNQDQKVKENWGKKIQNHKKYLVYCVLRARMTLRLGGSSHPTEKEVENEVVRIKRKDYTSKLMAQDVIAAFERGDEHISIVKLRCINYKHERETELANAQVRSDNREKDKRLLKKNGGVGSSRKSMVHRKNSNGVGKQQRVSQQELDDDSFESEDLSD